MALYPRSRTSRDAVGAGSTPTRGAAAGDGGPRRAGRVVAALVLAAAFALVPAVQASAVAPPTVVGTFTTSTNGGALLLKPTGANVLYAANAGGGLLSVTDLATSTSSTRVLRTGLPGASFESDQNDAGTRLYVTSSVGIDVFDITNGTSFISFIPAPAGVSYYSTAVDPASGNLFVAGGPSGTSMIYVIDPATGVVLRQSAPTTAGLSQLAIDGTRGLLYVGSNASLVSMRTSDFSVVASSAPILAGGNNRNGFAIDSARGRVFAVTGATINAMTAFDADTLATISTIDTNVMSIASFSYLQSSDYLVVAYMSAAKPRLIDLSDGTVTEITAAPFGLNRGITVDQVNGYIYNHGTTNNRVTVLATAPDIVTTSVPAATTGVVYSAALTTNGSTPRSFAVTAGALPAGLAINSSTGAITGTPTVAGTFTFTVTVTNAAGTDQQQYSLVVSAPPVITTTSVPDGTTGTAYSTTVQATGTGPITFAITSGALPAGISLDPQTGVISGTPTADGPFSFSVTATNVAGSNTVPYTAQILTAPAITSPSPAAGTLGSAYTHTVTASGTAPMTFAISSGALPTGLTLDIRTGVISGTPTVAGSFTFTVTATNAAGTTSAAYSVVVAPAAPTGSPAPTANASTSGAPAPTKSSPGELATTGVDQGNVGVVAGIAALLVGGGAFLMRRRTRQN
ncbi:MULTISPECIES: putative Ig domain-containing protein [Microbacterium]|uniref:putative Ig domain-containing protein n=1 Tax=Microbacterium TaxID=33882 RepID=UPI0027874B0C|nr:MULTISPECIES: putative Ig domain-containing protein [Microbacterium]MDQ1083572.1 LPXTG-motif cell wall-anchored protein [Microbacterium sp. SORGH_AS_0344]MDQ1171152.1 LPXTG-motif cell wall-anchored protein [Microbacterium proteolyticum]